MRHMYASQEETLKYIDIKKLNMAFSVHQESDLGGYQIQVVTRLVYLYLGQS